MDRDYELYREWDAPFLTRKPSDYFRTNCFVGTEADEAELQYTIAAVGEHFPPGTRVTRPAGGYVLWVEMPEGADAFAVYRQALAA